MVLRVVPYTLKKSNTIKQRKQQRDRLDLAQVAECVTEFKAFARGGLPGIGVLSKVWKNIMKRYDIDVAYAKYVLTQADLAFTKDGGVRLINAPLVPEPLISEAQDYCA